MQQDATGQTSGASGGRSRGTVNVTSLGIALAADAAAPAGFVDVHGGDGLTVGQVCDVIARSARQSASQTVARIQECVSREQVDMVLDGFLRHVREEVTTVDDLSRHVLGASDRSSWPIT